MCNFDYIIKKVVKEYNSNQPQILDDPYRINIVGGSRYGKINALLNLISHQQDIDKTLLNIRIKQNTNSY